MIKKLLFFCFLLCLADWCVAATCSTCPALAYKQNKNQWDPHVLYKTGVNDGSVFLCRHNFTFLMEDTADMGRIRRSHHPWHYNPHLDFTIHLYAFRLVFENMNPGCTIQGSDKLNEYYNYYIGNDRSKWAAHVNGYYNVTYHNIYKNIDLVATSQGADMKYNFIVKKGGKASDISVHYEGAENVQSDKDDILIQTSLGILRDSKPYAYQQIGGKKQEVKCAFQLKGNKVCFAFPEGYDVNEELIIDPVLIFSTFSGSTADNFGYSATYDSHGNAYAAGTVFQADQYPVTTGAFQTSWAGGTGYQEAWDTIDGTGTDIGITKYDSSGTQRIYSTYLGGDRDELPHSLVVNSNDELLVLGTTGSNNFPVTPNAYDTTFQGGPNPGVFNGIGVWYTKGCDMFITHFNADGTALLGSTYLGGKDNDGVTYPEYEGLNYNYADEVRGEINVDKNGNVYVASCTRSSGFPVTAGAYQTAIKGQSDGVVVKMNGNLTNIIWSTFLGGSLPDAIYSLDFDNNGNLYLAGGTQSRDFPVTSGVIQPSQPGGRADGFIAHLSSDGSRLLQSTYYGSPEYDQVYFVRTDKANNPYVFGQTEAVDSTFIKNALYNKPRSGQFISKLTPALDSVIWSTVFGSGRGQPDISPTAFLVDVCNKTYISGWGSFLSGIPGTPDLSTGGLQVTGNAWQPTTDSQDFYVMVMNENASALDYATYFGASNNEEHVDGGTSRFDPKGIIYQSVCAGCDQGHASRFPTTPGAVSNTDNSPNCNNAVFKLDLQLPTVIAAFFSANTSCILSAVQFTNNSKYLSTPNYQWSFGDGDTSSAINPQHTYDSTGTYTVQLIIYDSASCNLYDTISKQIMILASAGKDTLPTLTTCPGHAIQIGTPPANDSAATYLWTPANSLSQTNVSNPVATPLQNTLYQLIVAGGACNDTFTQQVNIMSDALQITGSNVLCSGDTVRLNVSNSNAGDILAYQWQPAGSIISGANSASPLVQPLSSLTYTVTGTNSLGCSFTDSIQINITSSLPSVNVTATPDTIHFGDTSQLQLSLGSTIASFQWTPDTSLSATNITNPFAYPRQTNTYYVQVVDSYACKKEDTITVYVVHTPCSDNNIFIPNGFSPNGDGKNDVLYVRGNGITDLYFVVYDRWGEKMFETHDINEGWDGTYKGKKMDTAVFAYYASGLCPNGEKFEKKGNVTLLR